MHSYYLTTFLSSTLCLIIIYFSIIRLGLCYKNVRPRLKYTALIFLSLVTACQPYYIDFLSGMGTLSLAICIIILMVDGTPALKRYKDQVQVFDTQIFDPEWLEDK